MVECLPPPEAQTPAGESFVAMTEGLADVAVMQAPPNLVTAEPLITCEGCGNQKPRPDFVDHIGHQYNMCLPCRTNLGWRPPDAASFPYDELANAEHVVYDHETGNYVAMTSAELGAGQEVPPTWQEQQQHQQQ